MRRLVLLLATLTAMSAHAADYPTPQQGDWIAHDFRFHTGEVFHQLKLHYTTVGDPHGQPVLIIHGTGGSGASMLTPAFAGELFGPGQPLDATKYFIILPDTIGAGGSSKPSDGLRTKFPHYDYSDMVQAEYRLVTEGLGIHHLRLVMGNSMGGMQTWMWGEAYPDFMDALVPMASLPTPMASRNWMMRRLMVETIQHDPEYHNGNYKVQPPLMRYIVTMFSVATSGVRSAGNPAPARTPKPTRWLTSFSPHRRRRTQTTSSTSGHRQPIMTPLPASIGPTPRCWSSTPPMMSATRRKQTCCKTHSSACPALSCI